MRAAVPRIGGKLIDPVSFSKIKARDNFYLLAWRDADFRKILAQSLTEAGL